MIQTAGIIYLAILLASALLLVVWAAYAMIEDKRTGNLAPFILLGATLCFEAGFIIREATGAVVWMTLDPAILVIFIWMIIILWWENE